MKMKKRYIFLLILIILLPTLIFVLKKNDIEISEVFNRNQKTLKTNNPQGYLLSLNTNYEVKNINNPNCSIKWDMNDADGFEGAYFEVGGNVQLLEYYIDNCGCGNNLKNFIAVGQKSIYESKCGTTIAENNKCNNIAVTDSHGNTRNTFYFNGLVRGENCSSWKSDDTNYDGTDDIGDFYWYKGNENNSKCYYDYSKEVTGKTCNYVYDSVKNWNLYLVNGCTYELSAYIDKCAEVEENKCGDTEFKQFLIQAMDNNNWFSNHINIYNSNCSDKIEYGTVVVYQNDDAYGLDCNKNGWEWNDSVSCKRSATGGTIDGPNIDNLTKYGTRKFIGWSTSKSCDHIDRTNNTFDMNFTGTKTYYACFERTSTSSALFESNNKKEIDIKYVNEKEYCSDTDTKLTNTYYRKTTEIEPYKTTLAANPYCNVVCEDDVKVSYPSIFETVPAGQYFELMYEPEITATRTCTNEFNYNKWKEDYNAAVDAEIIAMNELNKAKANLEAAENLYCDTGTCIRHKDTINADGSTCSGCGSCDKWKSSDDDTEKYYHSEYSHRIDGEKQSVSETSTESASDAQSNCNDARTTLIGDATSGLTKTRNEKINAYKDAVTKRIKLEQNNYQCYTILDQDNNTKNYSEVFDENYEYGNDLKVNETEYELKTPMVSAPTSNSSTSSDYTEYINDPDNGGISTTILQQLNNKPIGTTVSFYAIYPKLTFKYDNGSNGKPYDSDDILNEIEKEEEILTPEAHVKLDTGAFTPNSSNNYTKDTTTTNTDIREYFYVDGSGGYHISFNAYTAKTTTRQVQYYFTYREPKEYFSKKHNGEATKIKPTGEAYISLSKNEKLTDKDNYETAVINHVYPVALKAVEGNYYNGIILSNYQNMTSSNGDSNSYFGKNNYFGSDFEGVYACNYKVTNDALKLSNEKETYKDLKSNTIFRSVLTDNIDPNGRESIGNLGENWLNSKGNAVRELIKTKETHSSVTKDTYNKKNLEYSFTLTPTIINAIKGTNNPNGYNTLTNYDDFNLECTEDGRECISVFLTYLSDGKVLNPESIKFKTNTNNVIDHSLLNVKNTYSNYSSINNWNSDDLDDIREDWKYYIGDSNITGCTKQLDTNIAICKPNTIDLDTYNKLYETWGVLP